MKTNETILKKSLLALSIVAAIGLSGCNDDANTNVQGDSATNTGSTTTTDTTTDTSNNTVVEAEDASLLGNVAMGMADAIVKAYQLVDGDWVEMGQATTDASGAFSLTLSSDYSNTLPILLKALAGPATTMVCEVESVCNDFAATLGTPYEWGATVPVDPAMVMESVVPAVGSGDNKANITLLTHMAAARAKAASSFDDTAVNDAISELTNLVGTDILATPVTAFTADALAAASEKSLLQAAVLSGLTRAMLLELEEDTSAVAGDPVSDVCKTITCTTKYWDEVVRYKTGTVSGKTTNILDLKTGLDGLAAAVQDGQFDATKSPGGAGYKEFEDIVFMVENDIKTEVESVAALSNSSLIASRLNMILAAIGTDNILGLDSTYSMDKVEAILAGQEFVQSLGDWMATYQGAFTGMQPQIFKAYTGTQTYGSATAAAATGLAAIAVEYAKIADAVLDEIDSAFIKSSTIPQMARVVQVPGRGKVSADFYQNSSGGLDIKIYDAVYANEEAEIDLLISTNFTPEILDDIDKANEILHSGSTVELVGMIKAGNTVLTFKELDGKRYGSSWVFSEEEKLSKSGAATYTNLLKWLVQSPMQLNNELFERVALHPFESGEISGGVSIAQTMVETGKDPVTYTYEGALAADLVKLVVPDAYKANYASNSPYGLSIASANATGLITDGNETMDVDRELSIGNAAEFDTLQFFNTSVLFDLLMPTDLTQKVAEFNPNGTLHIVDVEEAAAAGSDDDDYYMDVSLDVVRNLDFGTLLGTGAYASSSFVREGLDAANATAIVDIDGDSFTFSGPMSKTAGWNWECAYPAGSAAVLPICSELVVMGADGATITIKETTDETTGVMTIGGDVVVNGVNAGTVYQTGTKLYIKWNNTSTTTLEASLPTARSSLLEVKTDFDLTELAEDISIFFNSTRPLLKFPSYSNGK